MIDLAAGSTRVLVDESLGARLASLVVDGAERLLTRERAGTGDPMRSGAYPMVPYAGRVRRGVFAHAGQEHRLPITLEPHAIHGTVLDRVWAVVSQTATAVELRCPLGPDWPWDGWVEHEVAVDEGSVTCRLSLHASDAPFPGQVGWHPWFADAAGPPRLSAFDARRMYRRDDDGMATADLVEPGPHPWDDCFAGVEQPVLVSYGDGVILELTSDCDHWVVYEPEHALCVEPQSGPPDGFTLAPILVTPGIPLTRWYTLTRSGGP